MLARWRAHDEVEECAEDKTQPALLLQDGIATQPYPESGLEHAAETLSRRLDGAFGVVEESRNSGFRGIAGGESEVLAFEPAAFAAPSSLQATVGTVGCPMLSAASEHAISPTALSVQTQPLFAEAEFLPQGSLSQAVNNAIDVFSLHRALDGSEHQNAAPAPAETTEARRSNEDCLMGVSAPPGLQPKSAV
jgi:hypothetical protein